MRKHEQSWNQAFSNQVLLHSSTGVSPGGNGRRFTARRRRQRQSRTAQSRARYRLPTAGRDHSHPEQRPGHRGSGPAAQPGRAPAAGERTGRRAPPPAWAGWGERRGGGAHLDQGVVDLHVRLDEAAAAHDDVFGAPRQAAAQRTDHRRCPGPHPAAASLTQRRRKRRAGPRRAGPAGAAPCRSGGLRARSPPRAVPPPPPPPASHSAARRPPRALPQTLRAAPEWCSPPRRPAVRPPGPRRGSGAGAPGPCRMPHPASAVLRLGALLPPPRCTNPDASRVAPGRTLPAAPAAPPAAPRRDGALRGSRTPGGNGSSRPLLREGNARPAGAAAAPGAPSGESGAAGGPPPPRAPWRRAGRCAAAGRAAPGSGWVSERAGAAAPSRCWVAPSEARTERPSVRAKGAGGSGRQPRPGRGGRGFRRSGARRAAPLLAAAVASAVLERGGWRAVGGEEYIPTGGCWCRGLCSPRTSFHPNREQPRSLSSYSKFGESCMGARSLAVQKLVPLLSPESICWMTH